MGDIVATDVQFEAEETLLENRQGVICTLRSMKRLKKALTILFAVFFLVSNVYAADYAKHITVIGTSDMHGNIWGFS